MRDPLTNRLMDVVIISPVCPFDPSDGHKLAVLSDVNAVLDSGLSLGLIAFTYGDQEALKDPPCPTKLIAARPGGGLSRLLRGLVHRAAPSLERLYSPMASAEIRSALQAWRPSTVIIDDSSVAGYVPLIREIVPTAKIVLRSHNVMHDVRREQLRSTSGPQRPAVKYDCKKYLAFERQAVESCDQHWSITQADADRMVQLYNRPCGYLSISLSMDRYTKLSPDSGRSNQFVHVGTIDFRRRADLKSFLEDSWPKFLKADSAASLKLAGKIYGKPIPSTNVTYAGVVSKDTDVYKAGRFAFNFQRSTGGIKVKTLTSLAAGRVLISTPLGVEGVPVVSGKHYWDLTELLSAGNLKEILRDHRLSKAIADAGRAYVVDAHSRRAIASQFQNLLNPVGTGEARSGLESRAAAC